MNFRITKYRVLVLSGVVAIALGGAVVGSIQWLRMQRQLVEQTGSTSTKLSPTLDIAGMSMGEKLMFQGDRLPLKLQGIAAYRRGDYAAAQRFFLQSWNEEARDPESLIYFNNARVSQKPAAVTLAVVISLGDENDAQWSKEILRGVAQAQKQFVDQGNALRIVIGDDGKDPQRAAQLAQQWVDLPEVLGVIGHLSSDKTLAAIRMYEAGKLVVISPTATSVDLSGISDYFFRTAPNDQLTGKTMATYLLQKRQVQRIAIVYNSGVNYSVSLQKSVADSFVQGGGSVPLLIDTNAVDFDVNESWQTINREAIGAIALCTYTNDLEKAIALIRVNRNQLPMVTGSSLYLDEVLQESAKQPITNLMLVLPWHEDSNPSALFPVDSRELWQGAEITWLTASSFDATQALIRAIQDTPIYNRQPIQQILANPDFVTEGAADETNFDANGDRLQPLVLVTIAPAQQSATGYTFIPIETIDNRE